MRIAVAATALAVLLPSAAQARSVPARQPFTRALSCEPGGTARVRGTLAAKLHPDLQVAWNGDRVKSARALATLRGSADLAVDASAGASCGLGATPVAAWNAPPITFDAGPVPIVVVPRVTLYVSAQAHVSAPVSARIHGSLTATAGLRYDGRVHRIGRLRQTLRAKAPRVRGSASADARITPSLELLLYGAAGPRFDFGTGLELDSGPPVRLRAPLEFSAGLRLPGLNVGPYTVLSRTIPLASAHVPRPAPSDGARIVWNTRADVDLHVWDERGRHTSFHESGIPGVLLSKDDTDGHGPERLDVEEPTGPLTYGVCLFDARRADTTTVTARLSGGVRRTATLRAEGDGVLIGGGGFNPSSGWCQGRH